MLVIMPLQIKVFRYLKPQIYIVADHKSIFLLKIGNHYRRTPFSVSNLVTLVLENIL